MRLIAANLIFFLQSEQHTHTDSQAEEQLGTLEASYLRDHSKQNYLENSKTF